MTSGEEVVDDVPVDVGQAVAAALELVGQPRMVHPQQVQDRGLQVVDVDRPGHKPVLVRRDRLAAVEAAWSRHGSLTDTGQLGRSGVEPGATT